MAGENNGGMRDSRPFEDVIDEMLAEIETWQAMPPETYQFAVTKKEETYREGYRDGFGEAIDRLHALMFDEGHEPHQAYLMLFRFWEHELLRWQRDEEDCKGGYRRYGRYPDSGQNPPLFQSPSPSDEEEDY